ncbi:hypothetical protein ACA910_013104 [Epithemia clementina (nom. ined.)]
MWSRRTNAFLICFCLAAHLGIDKSSSVAAAANARRRVMSKEGLFDEERPRPLLRDESTPSPAPSAGDDVAAQNANTPSPSYSDRPSAWDDFEEQDASTPSPSFSGMPSV